MATLDEIKKKQEEKKIDDTTTRYWDMIEDGSFDEKYKELWDGYLLLLEKVQQNTGQISPAEGMQMMKELGFTTEEIKDLLKSTIK